MIVGIPVLNRPDLLRECLASIDAPATVIVIDNSGTGEMGDVASEVRPDALIVDPPSNLGVAASWNFVIRTTPAAPWWVLANADVQFAPGDLNRLAESIDRAGPDQPEIHCLIEFGAFAINAAAIDVVGWFDENYTPIYCEDTDYRYRCHLLGVPILDIPSASTHVGSVSYRGNPLARNEVSYPANVDYYRRKWGGWIGEERFTTPFDSGAPASTWTLERRRLAAQAWGNDRADLRR